MTLTAKTMEQSNYFSVDYRSCPSGIGMINFTNKDTMLITEVDCGPKDMEQAKLCIKEEYLPTDIVHIPLEGGIHYKLVHQVLYQLLRDNDVHYVYDTEFAYEVCDRDVNDDNSPIFELEDWIEQHTNTF